MADLFSMNSVHLTDTYLEIEGEKFEPLSCQAVEISKTNDELKSSFIGIIVFIVGLIFIFKLDWLYIGIFVSLIGGFLAYINLEKIFKNQESCYAIFHIFDGTGPVVNRTFISKVVRFDNLQNAKEIRYLIHSNHAKERQN